MGCYEEIKFFIIRHSYDFPAGVKSDTVRIKTENGVFVAVDGDSHLIGFNLLNFASAENAALKILKLEFTELNELFCRILISPLTNERLDDSESPFAASMPGTILLH